jgi:(R)-2-hydroxyacyl-CoA dehydratese activating ATPase
MGWYVGVDVGSFTTKVVLSDNGEITDSIVVTSGTVLGNNGKLALDRMLLKWGLSLDDISAVVATGTGSKGIDIASDRKTDIICAARGISAVAPEVRTLIDIGAQSTQIIWVDKGGRVAHFTANEKCATGSGRFLQVISNVLRTPLEELGTLSLTSRQPVAFTTACAVFGESEAITRVSEGTPKRDIVAGVHLSIAKKIASLISVRGMEERCAVSGGGALDIGLTTHIQEKLGIQLHVLDTPQVIGALGAAIMGMQMLESG